MALTKVTYSMISGAAANVRDYGAVGDGVANDTAAFNAALAANDRVYVPEGTYLVNNVTGITNNTELFGDGWVSVLKQISTAGANDHVLDIQHNAVAPSTIQNIHIHDLQIRGYADAPVFLEHSHLVAMANVYDIIIERVKFFAFKGDGIYVGVGDVSSSTVHNQRVTIRDCYFDGVNNENRNGISIIDCTTCIIENNTFINTTRSNMPAAIDVEPDQLYHVVVDITIRNNRISACNGGIQVFITDYLTVPARDIIIDDNFVNSCVSGIYAYQSNASITQLDEDKLDTNITIRNNQTESCTTPITAIGFKRCIIEENVFQISVQYAVFGDSSFARTIGIDFQILNNHFYKVGSTGNYGCRIDGIDGLKFNGNKFTGCGDGTGSSTAINFYPLVPNAVNLTEFFNNTVVADGRTNIAVSETGAGSIVYDQATVYGNNFDSLTSIFMEGSGYITKSVVVPDSGGSPYDLTISLPPASASGVVNHIFAGWTHTGSATNYAQYVGVLIRGSANNQQILAISQTGSSGHSIAVQAVTATSVTLRLTYSFGGTFSVSVLG